VVIDIAKDAQIEKAEFIYPDKLNLPGYNPTLNGNIHQIKKAAELINNAQKPQILSGHGVLISHAEEVLEELAKKADIPITCTLHGLSSIPKNHSHYGGMLGMHGNYGANMCSQEADVLIAIGMRFDDRVTGRLSDYAKQAKIIHIDIDPAEHGKNVKADVPIVGDAKRVLAELVKHIKPAKHAKWLEKFKKYDKQELEKVIDKEVFHPTGGMKMGEIIRAVSDATQGKAFVVADVGQHQMMTARYFEFKTTDSFATSGGAGTMGFGIPAGMGAKVGDPSREVWVFVGDGCFQMTVQELITIAQEKIPVKIALMNNNYLGMVRQWQELFFDGNYSSVHLENPDFIKIAQGCGITAEKVTKREDIKGAIERARKFNGPYVIEFVCEKEENVFPMIPAGASVSEIRLE
jgi:acetolactate synthase-1/2/3 large subunit